MVKVGPCIDIYFRYPKNGKRYQTKAHPLFGCKIVADDSFVQAPYSRNKETSTINHLYEICGIIPDVPANLLELLFDSIPLPVPELDKIESNEIKDVLIKGFQNGRSVEGQLYNITKYLVKIGFCEHDIFYLVYSTQMREEFLKRMPKIRDDLLEIQISSICHDLKPRQDMNLRTDSAIDSIKQANNLIIVNWIEPNEFQIVVDIITANAGCCWTNASLVNQIRTTYRISYHKARRLVEKAVREGIVVCQSYEHNKIKYQLAGNKTH
jgi:hypothetical protein